MVDVRAGNGRAAAMLIERYRSFARYKARRLFIPGAEHEDLIQEAMMGLLSAIRDFDASKGPPFIAFAGLCIERQIHAAIKTANRQRNRLFENAVRLDASAFKHGDPDLPFIETLQSTCDNPLAIIEAADEIERAQAFLKRTLTRMEVEVLRMHYEGETYEDMAGTLQVTIKGVDNAMQRVRRKLKGFLDETRSDEDDPRRSPKRFAQGSDLVTSLRG